MFGGAAAVLSSGGAAAGFEDVEEENEAGEYGPGEGTQVDVDEDGLSGGWGAYDGKGDEGNDDIQGDEYEVYDGEDCEENAVCSCHWITSHNETVGKNWWFLLFLRTVVEGTAEQRLTDRSLNGTRVLYPCRGGRPRFVVEMNSMLGFVR